MSKQISRREAVKTAGATALAAFIPVQIGAAEADPIVAMFAERNRVYLEWVAAHRIFVEKSDAFLGRYPEKPEIPDGTTDAETCRQWRLDYDAWLETENGKAYSAALKSEDFARMEDEDSAILERAWDLSREIASTPAVSPLGIAIKLWVAAEWSDLLYYDDDPDEISEIALLKAFHDHCRLHGLTVVGCKGRSGEEAGCVMVGSDKGESV